MLFPCCVPHSVQNLVEKLGAEQKNTLYVWNGFYEKLGSTCTLTKKLAGIFIQENLTELYEIKKALELVDFSEVEDGGSSSKIHGGAPQDSPSGETT